MPQLLVYYNIRGKLQVIRHLLCYLGKTFEELHLQLIQDRIQQVKPSILQRLKQKPVNRTKLPLLVVGSQYIYGGISIALNLCKRIKSHRLLGNSNEQGKEIAKMMQLILSHDNDCKAALFKFAEKNYQQPEQEIKINLLSFYQQVIAQSRYIEHICLLIQDLNNSGFIYGDISIVDFYFFETCYYFLGFFGKIDEDEEHIEWFSLESESQNAKDDIVRPPSLKYLRTMRKYYNRFKGMPHYVKNKFFLQSFSIDHVCHSAERKMGMKKIWVENF